MSSTLHETLKKLGLHEREAHIYAALVELGPSLISALSRYTGLHRPTIYRALPLLQGKGLVTAAPRGKQKLYAAEPPEKLRALFEILKAEVERTLPELQRIHETQKRRPLVKVFHGRESVAFTFNDMLHTLKRSDTYYRYTSLKAADFIERCIPAGWRSARDAKKLQRFTITDALAEHQKKPDMNRAYKFVPPGYDLFKYHINHLIYGDKVVITDFENEFEVVIESPAIAGFHRTLFKILYDLL